jgi:hypothetical protein
MAIDDQEYLIPETKIKHYLIVVTVWTFGPYEQYGWLCMSSPFTSAQLDVMLHICKVYS